MSIPAAIATVVCSSSRDVPGVEVGDRQQSADHSRDQLRLDAAEDRLQNLYERFYDRFRGVKDRLTDPFDSSDRSAR